VTGFLREQEKIFYTYSGPKRAQRCGGMSIIKEIIAWILNMVRITKK
jgi:hypothetical protein